MAFSSHLLAWRRHRGWTQAFLSSRTGIPQPNIAALEGGGSDPRLSTIERLATALEISAGDLLNRRPPQPSWSRQQIDALVREAVRPQKAPRQRLSAGLRIVAAQKLAAAGHAVTLNGRTGERIAKGLRAELGAEVWALVVRRLDKYIVPTSDSKKRETFQF